MIPLLLALAGPARADAPAPGSSTTRLPVQQGLLVCPDAPTCEADGDWVRALGDGGPGGFALLDLDREISSGALPDDLVAREAWAAALVGARAEAAEGRWKTAREAADAGLAALERWRGPVRPQDLFELHFLRGAAAVSLGQDGSAAYSFRQAAAIQDGESLAVPALSRGVTRAWLDEQRKLAVTGRGEVVLEGGPPGTAWAVDGRPVGAGTLALLPGNHRVTATAPGHLRSWTVQVPVLPDRQSRVRPGFSTYDETAAVLQALESSFGTLQAPEEVADLLAAWCRAHGVEELRLMRVEEVVEAPVALDLALGAEAHDRPEAAAGEAVDMGDGVPTTFEGEVLQRHEARAEAHVVRHRRLRVVFFDPGTRRFSVDPAVATALRDSPERLRLGLVGTTRAMHDRFHLGGELALTVPAGPVELEARLGLVRAETPYNLYEDWVDRSLPHLGLGARWAPGWSVAPFAAAGLELYAPAAVGARAGGGLQARFDQDWRVQVEADAGLLVWGDGPGLSLGGGLGLSRGF